jgi:hypothetical protein
MTVDNPQPDNTPWHASLPADLQSNQSITKHTNVEGLARAYVSASSMIGKNPDDFIPVPKDDAGRLAAFRKLGAVDKEDGIKVNLGADAPETVKTLTPALAKLAVEKGIHPSHVQAIVDTVSGHLKATDGKTAEERTAQHAKNIETLKGEFGTAYDAHVKLANDGIAKLETVAKLGEGGGARLLEKLNKAGLGTDPDVIKALAFVGDITAEDDSGAARGGAAGGSFGSGTASAYEAKAREYQTQSVIAKDPLERQRLQTLATQEWEKAAKAANG